MTMDRPVAEVAAAALDPEHLSPSSGRSIFLYLGNLIVLSRISELAASANISHDTVDPCVFVFKDLLERGI
jgi:hypothetical protein